MGIDHDEAQEKFGFLTDACVRGAAAWRHRVRLGTDRRPAGGRRESSIREVIASHPVVVA